MNIKSPFEVYPAVFQVIAPSVMLLLGLTIAVLMDAYLNRKQRQVIEADEKYTAAYYFRAACSGALDNLEAALADYTVCIDRGYELAQTYYQRSQIFAAMGDAEKQASDLENSLKLVD